MVTSFNESWMAWRIRKALQHDISLLRKGRSGRADQDEKRRQQHLIFSSLFVTCRLINKDKDAGNLFFCLFIFQNNVTDTNIDRTWFSSKLKSYIYILDMRLVMIIYELVTDKYICIDV